MFPSTRHRGAPWQRSAPSFTVDDVNARSITSTLIGVGIAWFTAVGALVAYTLVTVDAAWTSRAGTSAIERWTPIALVLTVIIHVAVARRAGSVTAAIAGSIGGLVGVLASAALLVRIGEAGSALALAMALGAACSAIGAVGWRSRRGTAHRGRWPQPASSERSGQAHTI